ncbi:MAG TPA: phosphoribosyltransferase [Anaerolineae bacterium]|mgnify:CR=1 FL=1|nr:phosphoribosyltransferase [Anaerolineae bacterium]
MLTFVSMEKLAGDIRELAGRLPQDIDLVVGIPRDGLLIATILALRLDVALADIDGFCAGRLLSFSWREQRTFEQCRSALVIDDCTKTGATMQSARERTAAMAERMKLRYTVLYYRHGDPVEGLDIMPKLLGSPRCYEWRLSSHNLDLYAFDMDGVLCRNPSKQEREDEALYRRFLNEAAPILRPSHEIGWIVTGRDERYRRETERWLHRHGIRYGNLVMRPRTERKHGPWKARVYRHIAAQLFVESSERQARTIAKDSRKPVLCNGRLY